MAPIHETTADEMTNPVAQPRRGSLAAMKEKFAHGHAAGDASRTHAHETHETHETHEQQTHDGRRGSITRMQEKWNSGGDNNAAHNQQTPGSPTGRRSSFAIVHDKLSFYDPDGANKAPAKVNVRETTADEMFNPPANQQRRSSFARMMGSGGGGRTNDERRLSHDKDRRMSGGGRRPSHNDAHHNRSGHEALEGSALDTSDDAVNPDGTPRNRRDSGVTEGTYVGQLGRRLSASLDKAMHPPKDVKHHGPRPGAMYSGYDAA